jgi:sugar lactone lactonase YvrE
MTTFHTTQTIRRQFLSVILAISALLSACADSGGSAGGTPPPAPPPGTLSAYSGNLFGRGNIDGTAQAARFHTPNGIAVDAAGNAYVADTENALIRKITPAGVVSTLAGKSAVRGSQDGTGAAASFNTLRGIAIDSQGNVFVTDSSAHTIRKITPAGVVSTFAGLADIQGFSDGSGANARFWGPWGIAIDSSDQLYIADQINQRIRKITSAGIVSTLAGSGAVANVDGVGTSASFHYPAGIAVSAAGVVYVSDQGSHRIRQIDAASVVTTLAGSSVGFADGTGTAAAFHYPTSIAVANVNQLIVADSFNNRVRLVTTAGGVVTTLAGNTPGYQDGAATQARFSAPFGLAYHSASDSIFIADADNSVIRKIDSGGTVSTVAGRVGAQGSVNASLADSEYREPNGVITDTQGNLILLDTRNHVLRKLNPTTNLVSTIAGDFRMFGGADGTGSAARFRLPNALTRDAADNLYVTDRSNHTIRKITPAGVVSTLAGSALVPGSVDGTGSAARFNFPSGVASDSAGNLFVTDRNNGVIRKITPAGGVTTFAGAAGTFGGADGTGSAARFAAPDGIAIDASGNLYISDSAYHTIRKISPAGVVSTLAGGTDVSGSADGVGTAARFSAPKGIVVDSQGNVYVADQGNITVRKITPAGVVSTVVGQAGRYGFTAGALPGVLADAIEGLHLQGRTLYISMYHGVAVVNNLP